MSIYELIAERKIQQAIENGDFDNLQNSGKPLPPDELEMVPEELRMSYKILKNAGIIPEELELKKSIMQLTDLLNACENEDDKKAIRAKLNAKQLRYNMIMESRGIRVIDPEYAAKIMEILS